MLSSGDSSDRKNQNETERESDQGILDSMNSLGESSRHDSSFDSNVASVSVFQDNDENDRESSFASRLASPLDRFAALVADLIVFMPLMAIAMAPFRRQALVAQLMNNEADWILALSSAAGIGFVATLLYQTVFIALWSATPGKRVLGLRVVSIWGDERPRLMAAFVRSFVWCFELLFCGIPWIAVYANERRRPLHDRAADTVVVTVLRHKAVGVPSLAEMSLASGAYAAILACVFLVSMVTVSRFKLEGSSTAKLVTEMEEKGLLCGTVGEANEEWLSGTGVQNPPRLAVAVALYGAEAIDASCLEQEADFAIWREGDRALAYLAKALTRDEDDSTREVYFEKACGFNPSSDPCKLSRFITSTDELASDDFNEDSPEARANRSAIENEIESLIEYARNGGPHYLRVWAVHDLMESREFARVLDMTEEPSPHRMIGQYFVRERAKALWGVDRRNEARLAMRSAVDAMDQLGRVELASWFCTAETIDGGCNGDARWACDLLSSSVEKEEQWLASEKVASAYIRGHTCRSEPDAHVLSSLEEKIPSKDGRQFVKALLALSANHRREGVELLKSITHESEQPGEFYYEATAKLVELANGADDLEPIKKALEACPPGDGWAAVGKRLISKLQMYKRWEQALEVGLRLVETERFDRGTYRSIVVSAHRAGQRQIALGFLENLARMDEVELSRKPASEDEFDTVLSELSLSRGGKR